MKGFEGGVVHNLNNINMLIINPIEVIAKLMVQLKGVLHTQ
jgi:hypothetical protein